MSSRSWSKGNVTSVFGVFRKRVRFFLIEIQLSVVLLWTGVLQDSLILERSTIRVHADDFLSWPHVNRCILVRRWEVIFFLVGWWILWGHCFGRIDLRHVTWNFVESSWRVFSQHDFRAVTCSHSVGKCRLFIVLNVICCCSWEFRLLPIRMWSLSDRKRILGSTIMEKSTCWRKFSEFPVDTHWVLELAYCNQFPQNIPDWNWELCSSQQNNSVYTTKNCARPCVSRDVIM